MIVGSREEAIPSGIWRSRPTQRVGLLACSFSRCSAGGLHGSIAET